MNQNNQTRAAKVSSKEAVSISRANKSKILESTAASRAAIHLASRTRTRTAVAEASKAVRPDDSRLFAPGEIQGLFNEAWPVWLAVSLA